MGTWDEGSPGLGRGALSLAVLGGVEQWHAGNMASGSPTFLLLQPLLARVRGQRCQCCVLPMPVSLQ